ncbi:MAG: FKBP-type peptidyl-prolyl cis-trans isomerase [Sporichthyaceae bacterium]
MSTSTSAFVRSRRLVRTVGASAAFALVLSLAACGGDDEPDAAAQPETGNASGTQNQPPAAVPVFPTPSAAPKGDKALKGVPAVDNASDFKKQPVIAKGTGDAPTQLVIRDLIDGAGEAVLPTDSVEVRYVGAFFDDGKIFDASWTRGADYWAPFPLNGVVKGFAGGIVGMKIGGRREIVIPGDLAYGANPPPGIPPNATLVFVVDLMQLSRPDTGQPDTTGLPE